jgi:hypothetical protein|tara:strand:- start:887 stop:1000 length:114 start_codon:yes stop_codon:yes gene_type:complete
MKTLLAIGLVIGAGIVSWKLAKMSNNKRTKQTNKYGQ